MDHLQNFNRRLVWTLMFALSSFNVYAASADPLPRATPNKLGFSASALQRIDQFYLDEISRDRIPGAVIAIARKGQLAYYKPIGFQQKATGTAMPIDAVFNLASMTKVLTVATALTLYEQGRLPLKSTLSQYDPQFAQMRMGIVDANGTVRTEAAQTAITIQDLMRHTSGLTYGARGNTPIHKMYPTSSANAAYAMTGPEFLATLSKLPLLYPPGSTWDYGFSIDVLGLVVEKISGQSLGAASQARIWNKLNMRDTTFQPNAEQRQRFAHPLAVDPLTGKNQEVAALRETLKFECGGSCAFSTAADYIRFGQMLLNGGVLDGTRVLSPKTVDLMTADHLGQHIKNNVASTEAGRDGYGFGLGVAVRTQPGVAATNGTVGDYSWNGANGTIFWVDPKEQLVVVVMAVSPGEIRKYYREQIAALVYGAMERSYAK